MVTSNALSLFNDFHNVIDCIVNDEKAYSKYEKRRAF